MAKPLTVAAVKKLKPGKTRREIRDAGAQSLFLVIQPSGKKSWAMRFRNPRGKHVKHTLGPVFIPGDGKELSEEPELGAPLTLAGARRLAAAQLHRRALKIDVASEYLKEKRRRRLLAIEQSETSFAAVSRRFIEEYATKQTRRWRATAVLLGWRYSRDGKSDPTIIADGLADRWSDLSVADLTRDHVADVVEEAERRPLPKLLPQKSKRPTKRNIGASPSRGRAVARCLSRFFGWCVDRRLITSNPSREVRAPKAPPARDRVLTAGEIRLAWRACDDIGQPFGALIQLLLITGARREEVARMTFAELADDRATWSLDGRRTKNKRPHVVPLPPLARQIVAKLPVIEGEAGYVFTTSGRTPVSGFSKVKGRLDRRMLAIAQDDATKAGRDPATVSVAPWRLHDLRRTAATGMVERGTPPHVVELILNHISGARAGVAGIYNRSEMMEARRAALEQWATFVAATAAGGNVVPMRRAKKKEKAS